mmetsp:Transcript_17003/g.25138  ORF Transcript_17003/g.25138 Transcript_17003/m.25138 type:complete len:700 (+) Transcript_17003:125-2224(+)|eukprot:CAMPEP_0171455068 /NCGR_PEP_ID=MMETSP0945-20130129/2108_1 /TAXON_ID=109269 /ORGANISM="Vaucheria litorea, Strain CCMP2940" /LENGTH=699 /DNA_ID=CAMNT_0011980229 /DNA_START=93 /DNA_END=2192 /DNA_ORIENTATION=-
MIASHFLLDQARRLGLLADASTSDEIESPKNKAPGATRLEQCQQHSANQVKRSSIVPNVPDDCLVRDLNTGNVFHAEKESKALLKQYRVTDPKKILNNGWWGGTNTITLPPPMFHLAAMGELATSSHDSMASLKSNESQSPSHRINHRYSCARDVGLLNEINEASVTLPEPNAELTFIRISGTGTSKDTQGNGYTTYIVEVKCKGADPPNWRIYRRYREFKTLEEELKKAGFQVPIMPPRKLMGLLDPFFVEQRRVDLESWLYQLVDYPSMDPAAAAPQNFDSFRKFLTADANNPPASLVLKDENRQMEINMGWGGLTDASLSKLSNDSSVIQMSSNQKVGLDDFEAVRVIGKGSFGKVTLVRKNNTKKLYAMKVLAKAHLEKNKQIEHTRTERRVLGCINHPFIVSMHYAWTTTTKVYFVLDYCPGGELFFHLSQRKKLPEYMARFYSAEIALALEHLHDNDIVYRDLKPENIILDYEGHVKLADFGLAKTGVHGCASGANSLCGTPEYLSPEILNRKGHGTSVDWWSLGMVLYEMLTGLPPWYTTDRKKLFHRLRNAPLTFPYFVSHQAADVIGGFLIRDPTERLGAKGFDEIRDNKFFKCIDWFALVRGEVKPPFNPCRAKHAVTDTRNFDKQFTRLPLESYEGDLSFGVDPRRENGSENYVGFTYRGSGLNGCVESNSRNGLPPGWMEHLKDQKV